MTEIVVTAQKRTERLQDVPISVTALNSTQLTELGVTSTKDLEFVVPSLVTNELAGWNQTFMRGVGTDIQNPGAEPGVPTYIDGVYNPFIISPLTGLMGIDRTEVLMGPQGTLYGRNAIGGTINIVTLTPTQNFDAAAAVTYGNFSRKELSGYVSGGVSSNVAVGIYAAGSDRDTFYSFSPSRPPVTPQHEDNAAVRIKVVATPTDKLTLTGTLEYARSTGVEGAAFRQLLPNATGFAVGAPVLVQYNVLQANSQINQASDEYRAILMVNQDLGWADLISTSAYQEAYYWEVIDVDATSAALVAATNKSPGLTDISEELRLQSPAGSRVQWVAGAYFGHNIIGFDPDMTILEQLISNPPVGNETLQRVVTNSSAVFGQLTFPLMDKLDLTLGGRYSEDQKKFENGQTATVELDTGNVIDRTSYPNLEHSWGAFTPKATLSYKLTPDVMAYATYSEGYKSGQYQPAQPSSPGPVDPEKLHDVEVGVKSELLDHRLRLNASGYHYNYKDLQVYSVSLIDGVLSSNLNNAAEAIIYGGEFSATALLFEGFTVGTVVGINHGTYSSFPAYAAQVPAPVGTALQEVDATGNPVQRLPDRTTSVNAEYKRTFADGAGMSASINWAYNSGFAWNPSNLFRQNPYQVTNARVGFTLPNSKITVAAWATNVFNAQYEKIVDAYVFGAFGEDAPPRMYGLTLSYKY